MCYEWDEAMNLQNQRKHDGISFEMAVLVFEDDAWLICLDASTRGRKNNAGMRLAQFN